MKGTADIHDTAASRLALLGPAFDALAEENARLSADLAAAISELAGARAERDAARGELEAARGELAASRHDLADARERLWRLTELLSAAGARRWCPSSERACPGQLPLFEGEGAPGSGEPAAGGEGAPGAGGPAAEGEGAGDAPAGPRRRGGPRRSDGPGAPVVVVEHEIPEAERVCPECGGPLEEYKVEAVRRVRVEPARVVVEEHRTHFYRCPACCAANAAGELGEDGSERRAVLVGAPAPRPPLPGSQATASAVAWLVHGKFVMHSPLARMEAEMAGMGFALSRQRMSDWLLGAHERYLSKVADRIAAGLLTHGIVHADETTVQVLREPGRKPTSKSYMWVFRSSPREGPQAVCFRYSPTRAAEVPRDFLRGWGGLLCADGYAAYSSLASSRAAGGGPAVVNVGCLAHVRRKFVEVVRAAGGRGRCGEAGSVALGAWERVDAVLAAEREASAEAEAAGLEGDARTEARRAKVAPLLSGLEAWLREQAPRALPGSKLAKAVSYALAQIPCVANALSDYRAELTNNAAERAVRPLALGRKNWLFCCSQKGAEASAAIYGVVETARANGLDPLRYVEWLLEEMPGRDLTDAFVDSLLPWSESVPDSVRVPGARPGAGAREAG